jgi:hypothetical protein
MLDILYVTYYCYQEFVECFQHYNLKSILKGKYLYYSYCED